MQPDITSIQGLQQIYRIFYDNKNIIFTTEVTSKEIQGDSEANNSIQELQQLPKNVLKL
jgi:hypothetical protein